MKKSFAVIAIMIVVLAAYSCRKTPVAPAKTAYLDLPVTPYQYFDTTFSNGIITNRMATLGRVLFYDGHLSISNTVSCASCHKQALAFADNAALSTGFEGRLTKRNAPGIFDLNQKRSFFWDGRENELFNLAVRPISNHVEMGMDDGAALAQKLSALSYYGPLFAAAYGDEQVTTERISQSIAMFMVSINSSHSRLDEYEMGNTAALTAQEIAGKSLFDTKYNCGSCHNNGNVVVFTTGGYSGGGGAVFLDIGLNTDYTDMGRGTISRMQSDNGTFAVPSLKNVALTAPYMHDGRYKTLGEVIDHYSKGIMGSPNLDPLLTDGKGHARSMNITEQDKQAIIAFLGTLTDNQMITDPKFSNPFKSK